MRLLKASPEQLTMEGRTDLTLDRILQFELQPLAKGKVTKFTSTKKLLLKLNLLDILGLLQVMTPIQVEAGQNSWSTCILWSDSHYRTLFACTWCSIVLTLFGRSAAPERLAIERTQILTWMHQEEMKNNRRPVIARVAEYVTIHPIFLAQLLTPDWVLTLWGHVGAVLPRGDPSSWVFGQKFWLNPISSVLNPGPMTPIRELQYPSAPAVSPSWGLSGLQDTLATADLKLPLHERESPLANPSDPASLEISRRVRIATALADDARLRRAAELWREPGARRSASGPRG